MKRYSIWLLLLPLLLIGVLWLFWRSAPQPVQIEPRLISPRGELAAQERSNIEIFDGARNSVVYIATTDRVYDPWARNVMQQQRGTGSGFLWDERGHVVTNLHVVQGAASARVRLNDGRDYDAQLVGASPAHDLAVLRIEVPDALPAPLPIGSSHDLQVGQNVFAIGNPFGLDWSLTTGIVSALNRTLAEPNGGRIEQLIQTDAAINPGNSGGPLLDSAGRLIGVNTAIYSPSGAYAGVGFAVPVDTVNRVVPQLIANGRYSRPALGISVDGEVNDRIMRHLRTRGVMVLGVSEGSGADQAGLRAAQFAADGSLIPGDIIVAIEDQPIAGVDDLLALLDQRRIGDQVRVRVLRDQTRLELQVQLSAGS